jgi:hypothetical protein
MDANTEQTTKDLAKKAAHSDLLNERDATDTRAAWWVGEMSYRLGIVDAGGMIAVDGEVARLFRKEYKRIYRRDR